MYEEHLFLFSFTRIRGYADWPWNGLSRIWRKEVSESPSTDLFQSALVLSVVSHKDHVWAPCSSGSSMHPSYSGGLGSTPTRALLRGTQIYLSFKPISSTSQEDAVRGVLCCIEKIRRWLIHDRLLLNIVNLGTGYENSGDFKSKNSAVAIDVEPTVTLHNLLFLVRKLVANKLVETFDWLSCRKKCVFVRFCAGSRPKKRTKT